MSGDSVDQAPAPAAPPLSAYMKLRPRLRRFVDAYVACGIASEAIRRIGYRGRGEPKQAGWKLVHKPAIAAAIAERELQAVEAARVQHWETLRQIKALSESDIRRCFGMDGELLPIEQLPAEIAASIASIEVEEIYEGRGEQRRAVGQLKKIRLWSKPDALKLRAQVQRLMPQQYELSGPHGAPIPLAAMQVTPEQLAEAARSVRDKV